MRGSDYLKAVADNSRNRFFMGEAKTVVLAKAGTHSASPKSFNVL